MVKRRTLTQAKVLATANQLIETKGIDGLTIRDLALVLDVRPQSIYNYVDSLSDLLDQVGIQFVQGVADQMNERLADLKGDEALMVFAQELRQACQRHRGLAPVLLDLNDSLKIPKTRKMLVKLYQDLFKPLQLDDSARVENTLYRSALFGFIVQELGGFFTLPADELDKRFIQTMQLAIAQTHLPED
ncbi:TetR/AcrR family transcriptional regulator [Lactiplantibacillus mudanjiangensis]|uniref:Transcription regulator (Putative) [Lactobacillus plantarum JDM1] n=1 Tax=Lactiplantibacillus mudanjiangensis TaxID=1296538 RepID=A0A660E8X9_9LACO|nr:TetR family transcriptional regulator [Lactiplantibacillus mudanjiangensis]VDG17616.1 transcription regulator (putative) [Lactobacillus plantarum JDM1] [Lactiplantibacillus mudanjiangensis]VDG23111.1 transcription regulator (putative) [Lactobacillus plantarum JDM1] [Lactiplantibacillus mudanjiangensis]VDG29581.1 transcription regulator (putative) [Lactobacillus plantarum JDM1] [Lactiplantibacillus mudanjiangensis]VDG32695.1 transcription regulator (putative) [Lactobacillus plantarum JDM1] [L